MAPGVSAQTHGFGSIQGSERGASRRSVPPQARCGNICLSLGRLHASRVPMCHPPVTAFYPPYSTTAMASISIR